MRIWCHSAFNKAIYRLSTALFVTQRGKGVAAVLAVCEYEAMQEKIELLEELCEAESQLASGLGVSSEHARAQVLVRINSGMLFGRR